MWCRGFFVHAFKKTDNSRLRIGSHIRPVLVLIFAFVAALLPDLSIGKSENRSMASIYDGDSRSDAARIGDVGLQIIRDWVMRSYAEGPDRLIDRKAPGPEPRLNDE